MKSYYNLAQALLGLRHPMEALETAKHAYQICLETRDSSSELLSQFILRTKQAQWQSNETARLRQLNETLANVEDLLQQQLEKELAGLEGRYSRQEIGEIGRNEERAALEKEAGERRSNVREAFRNAQIEETAERVRLVIARKPEQLLTVEQVVPDYLIDGITFEIMHDPVITPSGVSYERISILRHLKASPFDPLTREPLSERQLIPNVALKNASSEFLEKNGWAIDY
jgi:STIP1 homology and U-box containing protein 1